MTRVNKRILTVSELYQLMLKQMGPQHWLEPGIPPAESPWEILWGGILIQNTNWHNVDYSLANLKAATNFEPQRLATLSKDTLMSLIQPSGFYTRKVVTLQSLITWFAGFEYDLNRIRQLSLNQLRTELLAIKGIGPETADYFCLYVFEKPVIIVDTYLRRLFQQLGVKLPANYQKAQQQLTANSQFDLATAQEWHALIVEFGKLMRTKADWSQSFLVSYQLASLSSQA